jgi:hypothetical protein
LKRKDPKGTNDADRQHVYQTSIILAVILFLSMVFMFFARYDLNDDKSPENLALMKMEKAGSDKFFTEGSSRKADEYDEIDDAEERRINKSESK